MNCPRCQGPLTPGQNPCPSCGQPLMWPGDPAPVATVVPPGPPPGDRALEFLLPVNRSWVAIVAGYLGLFAILMFPAPLALLVGILAIWHLRRNPGRKGMGRAIFGIVMGGLFTILLVIILVAMAAV